MSEGISPQTYITFFKVVFQLTEGFLSIFMKDVISGRTRERYFRYPQDLDKVPSYINKHRINHHIWFCPQLLDKPKRKKENITTCVNVWADLDDCHPKHLLIEPTILIESSPKRWQALWILNKQVPAYKAEELSKRVAYFHRDMGADVSGWDLTQLLRVPFTINYKYEDRPPVQLRKVQAKPVLIEEIGQYPELYDNPIVETPIPDISKIDVNDIVKSAKNPLIYKLFTETPNDDWSGVMWNLQRILFENGYSNDVVYAISRKANCNKYNRDHRGDSSLWREVLKAERFDTESDLEVNVWSINILSDEDRDTIGSKKTFIEQYINWAKKATDAAPQFHEACAFMVLSSILCGTVHIPTSFGNIYTNLWVFVLANSTMARKSTSMNIAVDMIKDLDKDIILANEGSIEGMISLLQDRTGKPSMLHKDEVSGFIEAATKKDYMAGMLESLAQLYDGTGIKRVLRSEQIYVEKPRFLFLCGGYMDKIDELLSFHHVYSGFIPRFIIIRAQADITTYRPLGPPVNKTISGKAQLLNQLRLLYGFYNRPTSMSLDDTIITELRDFPVELTDEAWRLYAEYDLKFLEAAEESDLPGVYGPLLQRLCMTGLKMSALLASLRMKEKVVVTEDDVKHAFYYIERWGKYSLELVNSMGKSVSERTVETAYDIIRRHSDGMHQSALFQRLRLMSTTGKLVVDTLKERGMIRMEGKKLKPIYKTEKIIRRDIE